MKNKIFSQAKIWHDATAFQQLRSNERTPLLPSASH